MQVYDMLLKAAEEVPDRPAVEFWGSKVSYKALTDEALKVGGALQALGIKSKDAVGLMLPNVPPFVSTLFGSFMIGARVVPMNVLLTPPEVKYLVEDSNIRLIVVWEAFVPSVQAAIKDLADPPQIVVVGKPTEGLPHFHTLLAEHPALEKPVVLDDDHAVLTVYTSGTTGHPKGALLTNSNIAVQLEMMNEMFVPAEGDKSLCVLPLFHVFALNGVLLACVKNQTTAVLHPKFELDAVFKSLVEDGITMFAGVPTMYFYLLKHPEAGKTKFEKLRYCFSGGAAMPVDVMRQFEEAFGVAICEGYGLTETTVSCCINPPDGVRKPGSIGLPLPRIEMKIVDEQGKELGNDEVGEIAVKGPNVMQGYLNKEEATAEAIKDGYFHTGDLGYRDEDGYYFIVDRKKDMIIKGGYNIYPREIEEVLYQMPEVAEAAVVGIMDEAKGETVRAVIALKPEKELHEEDIMAHLEASLAKYKLPQDYLFVDELPKGATGKILKREIVQNWEQWNSKRVQPQT